MREPARRQKETAGCGPKPVSGSGLPLDCYPAVHYRVVESIRRLRERLKDD